MTNLLKLESRRPKLDQPIAERTTVSWGLKYPNPASDISILFWPLADSLSSLLLTTGQISTTNLGRSQRAKDVNLQGRLDTLVNGGEIPLRSGPSVRLTCIRAVHTLRRRALDMPICTRNRLLSICCLIPQVQMVVKTHML